MLIDNNKSIGGYFEFSLSDSGQFPYTNAKKYNSSRSAFYDLLEQTGIKKIWMPKFICNTMIDPLIKMDVNILYYDLDANFNPILPTILNDDEYIFYVNYFGLYTSVQKKLLKQYSNEKLIFDHSQAFFVKPFECFATFYSLRKFLPVAEGGLLYTTAINSPNYVGMGGKQSIQQYQHLFIRCLSTANEGYELFKDNETVFNDCLPRRISSITENILHSLNYSEIRQIRLQNFKFLHAQLADINQLTFDVSTIESPLTYPLLLDKSLSVELIKDNIFTPTYWTDSLERVAIDSFEYQLISNTTHLVCDQRYSAKDMQFQIDRIKEYFG